MCIRDRLYRKRLREEQRNETLHYTNELHDALIAKNGSAFWKCWKSKFNSSSRCEQVDGCTDKETIANNFVNYLKEIYSCNNLSRAQELENEYSELRAGALKMQDMKMKDQTARHENAGHENAGHENATHRQFRRCCYKA